MPIRAAPGASSVSDVDSGRGNGQANRDEDEGKDKLRVGGFHDRLCICWGWSDYL